MVRKRAVAFSCGALALSAIFAIAPLPGQEAENDEESKFNYTVIDGRVDESTMMGFTVYTGSCMPCHGPDGLGSAFAPSLVRAAERRTFEDFARSIIQGRDVLPGQVMPSFADDVRVMSHVQDIWNYLGARAEGGLGRGRPRLIEDEQQVTEGAPQGTEGDQQVTEGAPQGTEGDQQVTEEDQQAEE